MWHEILFIHDAMVSNKNDPLEQPNRPYTEGKALNMEEAQIQNIENVCYTHWV